MSRFKNTFELHMEAGGRAMHLAVIRGKHVERLQQRQYAARELAAAIPYFAECSISKQNLYGRYYLRAMRLMTRQLIEEREAIAASVVDWFYPQDTGPYAVHSMGEAGVVREEVTGLHYPYQALAIAEELQAVSGLRLVFAVNTDDPEENVERADEAYWVDFPRLCEANRDKTCDRGCGTFECREVA